MKKVIMLSGFAGQGIVNTGITLSKIAERMGKNSALVSEAVSEKSEISECIVVVSDKKISSSRPRSCDILVAMNKKSYDNNIEKVAEHGMVIVNSDRVKVKKRKGVRIVPVPVDSIVSKLGNAKILSTVILSVLIGATDIISEDAYFDYYEEKYKESNPEIIDTIIDAFEKGIVYGENI